MSTELKSVECLVESGDDQTLHMTRFWAGMHDGKCVQLTPHVNQNFVQLTKSQALDLAVALVEFANDSREEKF